MRVRIGIVCLCFRLDSALKLFKVYLLNWLHWIDFLLQNLCHPHLQEHFHCSFLSTIYSLNSRMSEWVLIWRRWLHCYPPSRWHFFINLGFEHPRKHIQNVSLSLNDAPYSVNDFQTYTTVYLYVQPRSSGPKEPRCCSINFMSSQAPATRTSKRVWIDAGFCYALELKWR